MKVRRLSALASTVVWYRGASCARSEICLASTAPSPMAARKVVSTTRPTAIFLFMPTWRSALTSGDRTKLKRTAMAIGTRISRAKYRMAIVRTTMTAVASISSVRAGSGAADDGRRSRSGRRTVKSCLAKSYRAAGPFSERRCHRFCCSATGRRRPGSRVSWTYTLHNQQLDACIRTSERATW